MTRRWQWLFAGLLVAGSVAVADPLRVKNEQGSLHAFLLVRDPSGAIIGTGDGVNMRKGSVWTTRMTLRYKDGSVDDDTTVYLQTTTLRLISDHHVQKGPSYPKPMDMTIDMAKKSVTWHDYKDGKDEVKTDKVDLPADVSNGLLPLVLMDLPKGTAEMRMGYVVATPKPRLIKMVIHPDGKDPFRVGESAKSATRYRFKVELGGLVGVIAPLVGKEPPDLLMWVTEGDVPTFVRLTGSLAQDAPVVSLELSSPVWTNEPTH